MDFQPSQRCSEFKERLTAFMDEHIYPAEAVYERQLRESGDPHHQPAIMEELKTRAREAGLWNMFLPDASLGAGLSNSDYAPLAEILGRSSIASEACNCSAPDTGNMEVLYQFATPEQKDRWLTPLLDGEIRSAFAMTEPDVASLGRDQHRAAHRARRRRTTCSTAASGGPPNALHPHCRIMIVMGKTTTEGPRHRQQSQILVPLDTPGVTIVRGLTVFGYEDQEGHAEVDVRGRARPRLEPDRGRGRRLHDRPGPPRPGTHPPLHARTRRRRAGARGDVRPRRLACHLRPAARHCAATSRTGSPSRA